MRAEQLRDAVQEIQELFAAAGVTAHKELASLAEFIDARSGQTVEELVAEIRAKLDPAHGKRLLIAQHVASLKQAGASEQAFLVALEKLQTDKAVEKDDMLQVLKDYGVIRNSGNSRKAYVEALRKHFYWLQYNRDADALAKRATPW